MSRTCHHGCCPSCGNALADNIWEGHFHRAHCLIGPNARFVLPWKHLSAHSKSGEGLIRFLAGSEGQEILLRSGFSTPALRSAATSPAFLAPPPEHPEVFTDAISVGRPMPFTPAYVEMADLYRERMALMWEGREPVAETTAAVDAKVDELLRSSAGG